MMESLRKTYADEYKKLFTEHELVVSNPFAFRRGHDIGRGKSAISIKQKLPFKMYLGVNTNTTGKVEVKRIKFLDPEKKIFVDSEPYVVVPRIQSIITVFEKVLHKYDQNLGLTLTYFSERPRGYGIKYTWILVVLFSLGMFVIAKKIHPKIVNDHQKFARSEEYYNIALLASYIKKLVFGTQVFSLPFLFLLKSVGPVMQSGVMNMELSEDNFMNCDLFSLSAVVGIEDIKSSFAKPVRSITGSDEVHVPGIDYGIIHFGQKKFFQQIRSKTQAFFTSMNDVFGWLEQYSAEHNMRDGSIVQDQENTDTLTALTTYLQGDIMKKFIEVYKSGGIEKTVDEFIQAIVNSGLYHCMIEKQSTSLLKMYALFDRHKHSSDSSIGVIPLSSIETGGTFLFVVKEHLSRSTMNSVLRELEDTEYGFSILYTSRKDGVSGDSIRVEQAINHGVYSDFIEVGSARVIYPNGEITIENHYSTLTKQQDHMLFDVIHKKIYIRGKKATHKHLRSQSATIEIMTVMMDNIGRFVDNSQFPVSSYSKNKNEMIGKILTPFVELMKAEYNENIAIDCRGGTHDFMVCLEKKPINIVVIEKVL